MKRTWMMKRAVLWTRKMKRRRWREKRRRRKRSKWKTMTVLDYRVLVSKLSI
jgi:hypothetical protein